MLQQVLLAVPAVPLKKNFMFVFPNTENHYECTRSR